MKNKTTKDMLIKIQNGARGICYGSLTNELTNSQRDKLFSQVYHLGVKAAVEAMEQIVVTTKLLPKSIIVR